MKRHIFVIMAALAIGITLSACGPTPVHELEGNDNIVRQIGRTFDKNDDS